ncbi:MAG: hypothetical protein LUG50_12895 [Planctomycetaceae bacterium]|nr:hypothetical protein [Planctomycetaceae bacterium]
MSKLPKIILLFVSFLCGACNPDQKEEQIPFKPPQFANAYKALLADDLLSSEVAEEKNVMTLNIKDMPLKEFLTHVSGLTDVSIISEQSLDEGLVTLNVVDSSVEEVLSAVARRFGVDIISQDGLYYIGSLNSTDRGYLVRKVRRLYAEEIGEILKTMNSDIGSSFVNSDGLIVVADNLRVLKQIDNMLNEMEKLPANAWILQMYLITTTNKNTNDYGFDVTADFDGSILTELDTSAAFARSTSKLVADSEFRAVLRAARNSSAYNILAEPMMLLVDGGKASIRDGKRFRSHKRPCQIVEQ